MITGSRAKLEIDNTIDPEIREIISAKIADIGEGFTFRETDLDLETEQIADFHKLRDIDYGHLFDGNLIGIVGTNKFRRLPSMKAFIAAFQKQFDCRLRETGDRTSWSIGLKKWEPIKGYRYYTTGQSVTMSMNRIRIELINAPDWVFDEEALGGLAISILDTFKDKETEREFIEWARSRANWREQARTARDQLVALSQIVTQESQQEAKDDVGDQGFNQTLPEAATYLEEMIRVQI